MTSAPQSFADRYGPWALVLGASDGIGEAFARALAERGVSVVLIARRAAMIEQIAASIRAEHAVEARTLALDLSAADAAETIIDATSDVEIGMLFYCAGADPVYEPFLEHPVEDALAMVRRNCLTPIALAHHFAAPMVSRAHGAIVLLSSAAGLYGGARMVAYASTKAFDIVMGESLWAELNERGVDVLSLVLGATDTPSFRQVLTKHGSLSDPDEEIVIPGVGTVDEVVSTALANLTNGPTVIVGEELTAMARQLGQMSRSEAVVAVRAAAAAVMDTANQPTAP